MWELHHATRVLAAFALFLVLAMPLAGTWPDQNAGAQGAWDFWMESDMDLYGNNQTIRLFGNIGYAIADHPVSIKVVDERNNIVKLGQAQTDASGDFEATVGPIPDDGSYIVQAEHEFAGSAWATFTIGQLQLPEAVQEAEGQTVPEPEDVVPLPAAETGDAAAQSEQPTEREIITDIVDDSEDWLQFLLMLALGHPYTTIALAVSIMVIVIITIRIVRHIGRSKRRKARIASVPQHGPVARADTPARTSAVLKAARPATPQAGKTDLAAKLEGKLIAFDTNICINYMCVRFSCDDEMSDKARDFFKERMSTNMVSGVPDCIDAALKDGSVRLPWKTIKESNGVIKGFIRDGKMETVDKPKLEKARLFEIIFESHRSAHGDIVMGFDADDLVRVERMFDGFAKSPHPGMKEKMEKVYDLHIEKANEDEAKIAEVEKSRAEKKFPLDKGDGEILAAVLTNSTQARPICLITMDSDFTRFVGEIRERIGIEIVSGFQDDDAVLTIVPARDGAKRQQPV